MQLEEFFDYKNRLMEDLLTSESIVHLVDETLPFKSADRLAYTQIYPYEFIPETVEHGHTFICFDVDVQESINKTFLLPNLYIWVFTHKSQMHLSEGGVRTDKLCSEICKKINGSRFYGMGELNLYSVKRFAPATDFIGKCMTFHAFDYNKKFDPNKETPVNRKMR